MKRWISFILVMGVVCSWAQPSLAEWQDRQGKPHEARLLIENWSKQQVIYLGETHDQLTDHQRQLILLKSLHQQRPNMVIALEMVQQPYQSALDDYIAGKIDETTLQRRTEYAKRWGFDWSLYAPIFQWAKQENIPLLALNTPTEVTRKVSRQGLQSLTWPDRRFIPPLSEIRTEPPAYRQMLQSIFSTVHQGQGNTAQPNPAAIAKQQDRFERFFQAQVLWDETMAARIAQQLRQQPDKLVVVLAGQGHLVYRYGIPDRVERRIPNAIQQTVLLLSLDSEMPRQDQAGRAIADFVWTPSSPAQTSPEEAP
jgi:uncharacterized iron-regulated protein